MLTTICMKIAGDHGMFKILTQPDDFNDDLGIALNQLNLATGEVSDSASVNDLRDQFDEGKSIALPFQGI